MPIPSLGQNGWLLVAAFLILAAILFLDFRRKAGKPTQVKPLKAGTVAGMFRGEPSSFAEFKDLLEQPIPDPDAHIREVVRAEIDAKKKA
jgi:hypothetical protein